MNIFILQVILINKLLYTVNKIIQIYGLRSNISNKTSTYSTIHNVYSVDYNTGKYIKMRPIKLYLSIFFFLRFINLFLNDSAYRKNL